ENNIHCVLVDESQFLTRDQVFQLSEIVDRLDIPVLCFGLRTDFRGELFEGSQYLLAWADELNEIKTICHTGRKANFVVRVDDEGYALKEGAQVEIGGNERYVSVSRAEFKNVFIGGRRIKFIEPVKGETTGEDETVGETQDDKLL
ncbi:MAG: thymidine kinase, partial [Xanthomonadales bacterium]|nr:thymidine kinase [Xanthomonadales bacterium]